MSCSGTCRRCGKYADRLAPFLELFPRENILFIDFQEVRRWRGARRQQRCDGSAYSSDFTWGDSIWRPCPCLLHGGMMAVLLQMAAAVAVGPALASAGPSAACPWLSHQQSILPR